MAKFEFNKDLYPEVMYMHGPYLRKDNRLVLTYRNFDKHKGTISYPKYVYENYYNVRLNNLDDTIDHIDGNPLNNDISNLRLLDRKTHVRNDNKHVDLFLLYGKIKCRYCGKPILFITNRKYRDANRRGTGYFCNKSCAGKYGTDIQNGRIIKKKVKILKPLYYTIHNILELFDWSDEKEFSLFDVKNNNSYYTEFK